MYLGGTKNMEETKPTIEMLVRALLELTDEDFCEPDETGIRYTKTTPAVEECEEMANALLISAGGRCNWDNIMVLKQEYLFEVYAGEKILSAGLQDASDFPMAKEFSYTVNERR